MVTTSSVWLEAERAALVLCIRMENGRGEKQAEADGKNAACDQ